eukprot:8026287-Karenia_brevis.AAC.1
MAIWSLNIFGSPDDLLSGPAPSTPLGEEEDLAMYDDASKDSSSDTGEPKYGISIIRRGRFPRLHRSKACWRRPGVCRQDYELVHAVSTGDYHARCREGWPKGSSAGGGEASSSDSE